MKITNVEVRTLEKHGRLKGIAAITIDDSFVVHDIKLINGKDNELFIAMPSRKVPDGSFIDIVHPINQETRTQIQDLIIAKFKCQASK